MNRSTKRTLASMALAVESFAIFFGTLVAFGLKFADGATTWIVGLSLAFLAIILPGALRNNIGYYIGWAIQVAILSFSIWASIINPAGFLFLVVGVIVIGLWIWAMIAGSTIDAARIAWEKANGVTTESQNVYRIDSEEK